MTRPGKDLRSLVTPTTVRETRTREFPPGNFLGDVSVGSLAFAARSGLRVAEPRATVMILGNMAPAISHGVTIFNFVHHLAS